MMEHPILINRPIVVTTRGVRLCRPSEEVLDILPSAQQGEFVKEDGERVIDEKGRRSLRRKRLRPVGPGSTGRSLPEPP